MVVSSLYICILNITYTYSTKYILQNASIYLYKMDTILRVLSIPINIDLHLKIIPIAPAVCAALYFVHVFNVVYILQRIS